MILSILIATIPERKNALNILIHKLNSQIANRKDIEIIVLMDNCIVSIGTKRNRLKDMASGTYFCFLDDDDDIAPTYIHDLTERCDNVYDVIYFDTWATCDGQEGVISIDIENENEQFNPDGKTKRKPSHVNAWLTKKFRKFKFSDKNYGEDFDFCNQCYPLIENPYKINKILHYYIFDKQITKAI